MDSIKNLTKNEPNKLLLGYWDYPGRCQHIRLLLAYTKLPYDEKRYKSSNDKEWFEQDKLTLPLDFPNLPYLIDGQFQISENQNVLNYIAHKSGKQELLGKTIEEKFKVDEIRFMIDDVGSRGYSSSLKKEDKKLKDWESTYYPKLQYLSKFLGNKEWMMGYLTIADFSVYQRLMDLKTWFKPYYETSEFSERLDNLLRRFEQLEGVKEYMSSDQYIPY